MPELSPKGHSEVNKADRKECASRGNCPCKGLKERKNVCLLDSPPVRSWFGWTAGREPGP